MFYQKFVLFSFPTFRNSISSPSGTTASIDSAGHGHLEVDQLYAHTPNLFLKCFTKNFFCFHFQLFVTPSLLPAVGLHYWPLPVKVILKFASCWFPPDATWIQAAKSMPTPLTFFEMFYQKFVLFSFPTFRNSISSPSGTTALIDSARVGYLEVCKLLVSSKADLAARHRCGRCQRCSRFSLNQSHPLACSSGWTALKCAMQQNKSDVVAFLRSIGAPQWLHAAVACIARKNKIW